ncbi:MAG TPA: hypothetical protein VFR68_13945 [Candidatus Dormibacteraeota bacterium]|nr:hypothetical protein [Candidatus Dormibacteraeota bacterium]
MSYPWTRVPEGAPPVDRFQLRLLPAADLFMGLMLSRPGGLSLRTAWVTPATIALAGAGFVVVGVPGIAALVAGVAERNLLLVGAGVVGLLVAGGAGAVALFGIRQRLLERGVTQSSR